MGDKVPISYCSARGAQLNRQAALEMTTEPLRSPSASDSRETGSIMKMNKGRALLVAVAVLATFIALRMYLHLFPSTNLNIGEFNVHHLFTGLILMTVGGLPLVLFHGEGRRLDLFAIVFGAGLSMSLDEWVYLITTDGSDESYLLPMSLWGGVTMVTLALAYLFSLMYWGHRCASAQQPLSSPDKSLERTRDE